MTAPWPLMPPTLDQRDALRVTLLRARDELPLYRERFAAAGVTPELIAADPASALARLPIFDPACINRLANEALARRCHDLGGVDLSSGTSGGSPKRRVLSEEDVRLDAALLARQFLRAGVRAGDRVAAVDLTVSSLSVAFLEGCERLGVRESVALAVTPRIDAAPLLRLDPTVLIGPPSVLTRLVPALLGEHGAPSLRLLVYNGDLLPAPTAAAFRARAVGLRSLYGLTETSALGVGCAAEHGIHLDDTHVIAEIQSQGHDQELVVTTLGFSMPLVRYPTGDRVRPLPGGCACGSSLPRIEVLGRLDDQFALFDVKFQPDEFQALLLRQPGECLQIVLESIGDGRERVTVRLPRSVGARLPRPDLLARLRAHPLLDYLLRAGLVEVRLRSLTPDAFGRKLPAVVDRRQGAFREHG